MSVAFFDDPFSNYAVQLVMIIVVTDACVEIC